MLIKTVEALRQAFPPHYNLYYPPGSKVADGDFDLYIRILPEPASRIYRGQKKYELRKYVPQHQGLIFLSETGNKNEVTGCFLSRHFIVDTVDGLWSRIGTKATSREKFEKYFAGKTVGVALEIQDVERFNTPVPMKELQQRFPDFPQAPHPYVYLYTPVEGELSHFLRSHSSQILLRNALA